MHLILFDPCNILQLKEVDQRHNNLRGSTNRYSVWYGNQRIFDSAYRLIWQHSFDNFEPNISIFLEPLDNPEGPPLPAPQMSYCRESLANLKFHSNCINHFETHFSFTFSTIFCFLIPDLSVLVPTSRAIYTISKTMMCFELYLKSKYLHNIGFMERELVSVLSLCKIINIITKIKMWFFEIITRNHVK